MSNSTLIREGVWIDKQNAFAVAQAAKADAQRTASVAAAYDFARDDAQCILTAQGFPVQMAMTLSDKRTGTARTVIARLDDFGVWLWLVTDMHGCRHEAQQLIAAVQQRIGAKLTGQLTGKAARA